VVIRWRTGEILAARREWSGAIEYDVRLAPAPESGDPAEIVRALAYPALVGRPEPGDQVLLNTTALALHLGTGGYALIVVAPQRLPSDPVGPGHLVKARYTPMQAVVLGVDDPASPHRAVLASADSVEGMPVVAADLHSALPAVVAGVRADRPTARVAYVMTDGGALPIWFSRTVAGLRAHLAGTVTVGQALGGTSTRSPCTPGCWRPGTCSGLTSRWSPRARATSAPGPRGASPASRSARRSTRWPPWGGGPSPRCGCPTPTRASGTAACRTTR